MNGGDALMSLLEAHEMLESSALHGKLLKPRKPPRCRRCDQPGHYRNHCPMLCMVDSAANSVVSFRMKSSWTEEEDETLRRLVSKLGTRKWSEIAKLMPGRKGKQCRERWINHLNIDAQLGPWTNVEDEILMKYVDELGTKWTTIAKKLPGRSENAIKNRYYASLRKEERRRLREGMCSSPSVCSMGSLDSMPASTPQQQQQHQQNDFPESQQPLTPVAPKPITCTSAPTPPSVACPQSITMPHITDPPTTATNITTTNNPQGSIQ